MNNTLKDLILLKRIAKLDEYTKAEMYFFDRVLPKLRKYPLRCYWLKSRRHAVARVAKDYGLKVSTPGRCAYHYDYCIEIPDADNTHTLQAQPSADRKECSP